MLVLAGLNHGIESSPCSLLLDIDNIICRCSRVHVGGPSVPRGLKASAFSKCVCSNLMCINCNFKVIFFNHKQWSESGTVVMSFTASSLQFIILVDYMFFRNNFPNESKLSTMTSANDENTAYCCQCSWIQVKDEKGITSTTSIITISSNTIIIRNTSE